MPRLSVFVFLNLVELVAKRCKNHLHVVEYIESGKVLHAGGSFGSLVHAGWVRANKLQHPFSLELAHSHLILTWDCAHAGNSPILTSFSAEIVDTSRQTDTLPLSRVTKHHLQKSTHPLHFASFSPQYRKHKYLKKNKQLKLEFWSNLGGYRTSAPPRT